MADRGPGIPDAYKPTMFEKYGSVEARAGNGRRGVGLGLYMVRLVAAAHHGAVSVEDRAGGGTVFRLRLGTGAGLAPVVDPNASPLPPGRWGDAAFQGLAALHQARGAGAGVGAAPVAGTASVAFVRGRALLARDAADVLAEHADHVAGELDVFNRGWATLGQVLAGAPTVQAAVTAPGPAAAEAASDFLRSLVALDVRLARVSVMGLDGTVVASSEPADDGMVVSFGATNARWPPAGRSPRRCALPAQSRTARRSSSSPCRCATQAEWCGAWSRSTFRPRLSGTSSGR